MRIFLPLLCVLCASPVLSTLDGNCPKKDPPPGTQVLFTGTKLFLTCNGHVAVDGVTVRNGSNTNRRGSSSAVTPTTVNIITSTGVWMRSNRHMTSSTEIHGYNSNSPVEAGNHRRLKHTDTGYTASPTSHMNQPTSEHRLLRAAEMDGIDYEEEEEREGGSRVTRGIKSRSPWKWIWRKVGKVDRDREGTTLDSSGAALSLSSVRPTDSGTYTCYHRNRERFSLKVIVTDPLEKPSLHCFKKSPSSKIRCESTPLKSTTVRPDCSLLLSKSWPPKFIRWHCSYSSRTSRCWCALNHNEDELRDDHLAYLCLTSIAGNITSSVLDFKPLGILKPDPPSNVSVRQIEGQEKRLKVIWSLPISWKSQDNFFELKYELKYRPLNSSFEQEQIHDIERLRSITIKDALPGVEYVIQLRAQEQYDGVWSEWSKPVCATSWTAPLATTTVNLAYDETESSGDDYSTDVPAAAPTQSEVASSHILWIPVFFAVLCLVILAAYIFSHKDRFISKLQSLSVVTQCGDSAQPPPSVPTAPEGQALMTFGPPRYKQRPPSEVEEDENEEKQCVNERMEAKHFNNTSYFFLQQQ